MGFQPSVRIAVLFVKSAPDQPQIAYPALETEAKVKELNPPQFAPAKMVNYLK